jgi:hypothetical protein
MAPPKTLDELMERVLEIFPNAIIDEEVDGEILVHTNLKVIWGTKDDLEDMGDR